MADNDLEILSDYLNSEGFRKHYEHAQREWGPSGLKFQQAIRDAAERKEGAAEDLRMILRLQSEIVALFNWPRERLESLKHQRIAELAGPAQSRRGPGL